METSLEIRWFGPGQAPVVLAHRMDELGAPDPDDRTDTYLRLPGTEDVGVKLRDRGQAFEIKLRERNLGESKLNGTPTGAVERWQKWSFPIADPACRAAGLGLPGESLVDVDKSRRLLTYRLAPDGSVALADERDGDGCSVELTALVVRGAKWWSVGFEAFGTEDRLADALAASAGAFFAAAEWSGALAGARSCAYPAWLVAVT